MKKLFTTIFVVAIMSTFCSCSSGDSKTSEIDYLYEHEDITASVYDLSTKKISDDVINEIFPESINAEKEMSKNPNTPNSYDMELSKTKSLYVNETNILLTDITSYGDTCVYKYWDENEYSDDIELDFASMENIKSNFESNLKLLNSDLDYDIKLYSMSHEKIHDTWKEKLENKISTTENEIKMLESDETFEGDFTYLKNNLVEYKKELESGLTLTDENDYYYLEAIPNIDGIKLTHIDGLMMNNGIESFLGNGKMTSIYSKEGLDDFYAELIVEKTNKKDYELVPRSEIEKKFHETRDNILTYTSELQYIELQYVVSYKDPERTQMELRPIWYCSYAYTFFDETNTKKYVTRYDGDAVWDAISGTEIIG